MSSQSPNSTHSTAHCAAPFALPYSTRLIGTGSHFPKKILSNTELSTMVDTDDTWIFERTGIRSRRISEPTSDLFTSSESNSSLALQASLKALAMSGKSVEDIDFILFGTCTADTIVPSASCWLQKKLGATRAWALDVNAACSGFVYALSIADQYIKTGQYRCGLVIGSEVLSSIVNWKDRTSCILFGDGAGAVVVERAPADYPQRILSSHLHSDGSLWELFYIEAGGSNRAVTSEVIEQNLNKMTMKGKEIFKVAVKTLAEFAEIALSQNNLELKDLDWMIPHQANIRIIEAVAKRLGFPMEKIIVNIESYGNTSSATVPTALDEAIRDGRIRPGQTVLMDVFGAGLTYGSILLRW